MIKVEVQGWPQTQAELTRYPRARHISKTCSRCNTYKLTSVTLATTPVGLAASCLSSTLPGVRSLGMGGQYTGTRHVGHHMTHHHDTALSFLCSLGAHRSAC
jgi:hypothetical protein